MANKPIVQAIWIILAFAAQAALLGCTTFSAGKSYTLAKVDRDQKLIPHKKEITRPDLDVLDNLIAPSNPKSADFSYFGIKLNRGYLRYLQAIERPEVAILVKITISDPGGATLTSSNAGNSNSLVAHRVFLTSEDENAFMAMNKQSIIPLQDVWLLPPLNYSGEDIHLAIRILELDSEDNARLIQAVSTAAAIGAQFAPESAAAVSVIQGVLTFFINQNPDDIEFQFDLQLSQTDPSQPPQVQIYEPDETKTSKYDLTLLPRVGKYVLIKTEHPLRLNLPSTYPEFISHGVRYAIAQAFKLGTLGVFNWRLWNKQAKDRYIDLLGHPFALSDDAVKIPRWNKKYQLALDILPEKDITWRTAERLFTIVNDELYLQDGGGSGFNGNKYPFQSQSYLVFSIVPAAGGIAPRQLAQLYDNQNQIQELSIRTTQQTAAEWKPLLDSVTSSVIGLVIQKQIIEKYSNLIKGAKDAAEAEHYRQQAQQELLQLHGLLSPETAGAAVRHYSQLLDQASQRKKMQLSELVLASPRTHFTSGTDAVFDFKHAPDVEFTAAYRDTAGLITALDAAAQTKVQSGITKVTVGKALLPAAGAYALITTVTTPTLRQNQELQFFVHDLPDSGVFTATAERITITSTKPFEAEIIQHLAARSDQGQQKTIERFELADDRTQLSCRNPFDVGVTIDKVKVVWKYELGNWELP